MVASTPQLETLGDRSVNETFPLGLEQGQGKGAPELLKQSGYLRKLAPFSPCQKSREVQSSATVKEVSDTLVFLKTGGNEGLHDVDGRKVKDGEEFREAHALGVAISGDRHFLSTGPADQPSGKLVSLGWLRPLTIRDAYT